jgi:pimeloyl-ACP methyl ester carboxylesterase
MTRTMPEPLPFVLVHGAFHGPWCFEPLVAALARRGRSCTTPELPLTSLAADAAAVTRALDRIANEAAGRSAGRVVLLGHSYGGAVVTAAGGHPVVERIVLLTALAPDDGEAPNGGPVEIAPAFLSALRPSATGSLEVDPARAAELFYPDADPAAAAAAAARLRPGNTGVSGEKIARAAWRDRPTDYVVCADDPIILARSQRALAARTGAKVHELPGDHSPFLARPEALAALLVEIADDVSR